MQALTHPWIQGVAERLTAELKADNADNEKPGENNAFDMAKLALQGLEHFQHGADEKP